MIKYIKTKEGQSWLLAFVLIGFSFIVNFAINPHLQSVLGDPELYPGSEIPWYFIQRDFISSLSSLIGVLISIPLVFIICTRYKIEWSPCYFVLFISYTQPIYTGITIYIRAGNVINISEAVVVWPSQKAYLTDIIQNGWFLVLVVGLIVFVLRQKKLKQNT